MWTCSLVASDEESLCEGLRQMRKILKKNVVEKSDVIGVGTGHSLTISKHYENIVKELKERAKDIDSEETTSTNVKEINDAKKCAFAFSSRLIDSSSRMYLYYASSLKLNKDAFDEEMKCSLNYKT